MIKEYKILDRIVSVDYDEDEVTRVTKDAMECILVDLPDKIRADERAKVIEFVVDKIIFPLLNEYDIRLWEDIDYIELAEKWVEFVSARKGKNDYIANDLKNWIAERMKGGVK